MIIKFGKYGKESINGRIVRGKDQKSFPLIAYSLLEYGSLKEGGQDKYCCRFLIKMNLWSGRYLR